MRKNYLKWAAGIFILCAASCGELPVEKVQQEAWQTVKTINRHWAITENLDSLSLYLHPDMILVAAEAKDRLDGRDKILESYRSYTRYARTLSLQELDPIIRIYNRGRSAVVTYNYDLEIETPAGESQRFTGRDMYTLVREKDRWQAVAQHFSPLPKQ
jgi:ketosteroid isomerase-like protein